MRYLLFAASMLFSAVASAATYVSIGINLPVYPQLVRVPGYPVYYAPRVNYNVFFYDGLYWVYRDDRWYASSWYNGPWELVDPYYVPAYVLRVPVRYYRQPPTYFSAWAVDAAPRWGEYWGATWEQRRSGWDRWNRSSVPAAAPLPVYQRQYSGTRYPRVEQQQVILNQQYRYQPRDTVVRQYFPQQTVQTSVAPAQTSVATVQKRQVTQSAAATQSSSAQFAPGQVKNQQGAQSAKEFAPGQVKKQQNAQSAKEFAPGQVRKQQPAQTTAVAPVQQPNQQIASAPRPNENAKGRGKGRGNDEGEAQGPGDGQGKGHGKGHGRD